LPRKEIPKKISVSKPVLENAQISIKQEICEEKTVLNPFTRKLEFAPAMFEAHNIEHLKTYEDMYNPHQYQQSLQSIYTHENITILPGESDTRMTHYTEERSNFYTTDPSMFLLKEEDDFTGRQNLQSSPFYHKNYNLLQSPISKKQTNEHTRHRYRENYFNNIENNENINTSKGDISTDNLFYESPFLQKKVKFNAGISPNRHDAHKMSERFFKSFPPLFLILCRVKPHAMTQGFGKDLSNFHNYSPINIKFESPSK